MDLELAGKAVIVSGGGAGIGGAISLALAAEGAVPLILGRSPLSAEFRAQLAALQPASWFHQVDLADVGAAASAMEAILAAGHSPYGLVNNAGTNDGVDLERAPEEFVASVTANLGHYFALAHHALPHLRRQRGAIVNIASKTALTGQGGTSGYVAAKAAQLGLTREWAAALAKDGVRVNAVLPAEVMTPLYRRWIDSFEDPQAMLDQITAKIPLGHRMTEDREIADMVAFLLSPRSGHTTGQWIVVDGGYTHLDRALT